MRCSPVHPVLSRGCVCVGVRVRVYIAHMHLFSGFHRANYTERSTCCRSVSFYALRPPVVHSAARTPRACGCFVSLGPSVATKSRVILNSLRGTVGRGGVVTSWLERCRFNSNFQNPNLSVWLPSSHCRGWMIFWILLDLIGFAPLHCSHWTILEVFIPFFPR